MGSLTLLGVSNRGNLYLQLCLFWEQKCYPDCLTDCIKFQITYAFIWRREALRLIISILQMMWLFSLQALPNLWNWSWMLYLPMRGFQISLWTKTKVISWSHLIHFKVLVRRYKALQDSVRRKIQSFTWDVLCTLVTKSDLFCWYGVQSSC